MKKVLDGKVYDTETAKLIGKKIERSNGKLIGWEVNEWLYLTKSGNYFIHGCGGELSDYCVYKNGVVRSGEKIKPVTLEQAKHWGEENLDGSAFISEFGEPEEPDEKSRVTLYLKESSRQTLQHEKVTTGKSISAIVDELVSQLDKSK